MSDNHKRQAEQGDITAMLWCSRNLREPDERNFWWFKAIETAHSGASDFDFFARAYVKWERWFHCDMDPYLGRNALAPLHESANAFLGRRCGSSLKAMKSEIKPEEIEDGDYAIFPKKSLRRRLIDYRGDLFVAALSDCDQEGLNVLELAEVIRDGTFQSEVFVANEPAWIRISVFLIENWKHA